MPFLGLPLPFSLPVLGLSTASFHCPSSRPWPFLGLFTAFPLPFSLPFLDLPLPFAGLPTTSFHRLPNTCHKVLALLELFHALLERKRSMNKLTVVLAGCVVRDSNSGHQLRCHPLTAVPHLRFGPRRMAHRHYGAVKGAVRRAFDPNATPGSVVNTSIKHGLCSNKMALITSDPCIYRRSVVKYPPTDIPPLQLALTMAAKAGRWAVQLPADAEGDDKRPVISYEPLQLVSLSLSLVLVSLLLVLLVLVLLVLLLSLVVVGVP